MTRLAMILLILMTGLASAAPLVSPVETTGPLKLSVPDGWLVSIEPLEDGSGSFASASPDCLGDPSYKGPREDFQLVAKVSTDYKSAREWLKDQFAKAKQTTKAGWTCISTVRDAACVGKVKGLGLVMVWFGTATPGPFKRAGGLDLVRAVATSLRFTGKASDLEAWQRPVGKDRAICRSE